jgi:hypothetical protein
MPVLNVTKTEMQQLAHGECPETVAAKATRASSPVHRPIRGQTDIFEQLERGHGS